MNPKPEMPDAVLIAGANGAGKTTFARQILRLRFQSAEFLNADEIQREHERYSHPMAAGRELLRRLSLLESQGLSLLWRRHSRRKFVSGALRDGEPLDFERLSISSSCLRRTLPSSESKLGSGQADTRYRKWIFGGDSIVGCISSRWSTKGFQTGGTIGRATSKVSTWSVMAGTHYETRRGRKRTGHLARGCSQG